MARCENFVRARIPCPVGKTTATVFVLKDQLDTQGHPKDNSNGVRLRPCFGCKYRNEQTLPTGTTKLYQVLRDQRHFRSEEKGPKIVYASDLKSKDVKVKPALPSLPIIKLLKEYNLLLYLDIHPHYIFYQNMLKNTGVLLPIQI